MSKLYLSLEEKLQVFFSGPFVYIGLIFTTVGLFMLFFILEVAVFKSLVFELYDSSETTGIVTRVGQSNTTVNEEKVLFVRYSYNVDGEKCIGISYATSTPFELGDNVTVAYLPEMVTNSRIKGMDMYKLVPFFLVFLLIFPVIGISYLIKTSLRYNRTIMVLRNYEFGKALLKSRKKTKTFINDKEVYELVYSYHPVGTTLTTSFKTFNSDRFIDTELLVYSKRDNSKAVLLKRIPDSIGKKIIAKA